MSDDDIAIEQHGCARCGAESHGHMIFARLHSPVLVGPIVFATHWAMCPTLNEPILLRVYDHNEPMDELTRETEGLGLYNEVYEKLLNEPSGRTPEGRARLEEIMNAPSPPLPTPPPIEFTDNLDF